MAETGHIMYSNVRVIPDANSSLNAYFTDVLGNKTDNSSATAGTASVIALLRYIIANLSTDTDVAALIGAIDTTAHTGAVDDLTTVMGYLKQLITDERALSVVLGTPAGADLSTDIAAIKTVVDAISGYVDTEVSGIKAVTDLLPDAGALTSIAQASDLATTDGKVDTVSTAVVTTIPGLIGTPVADVATDIANLRTIVDTNDSTGTFSYLDAGGEQDVIEITNSTRKIIDAIWVDTANLTNNGTFKIYYKVDGSNYRVLSNTTTIDFSLSAAYNLLSTSIAITSDIKVTYEEASDEGAVRNIPYSVIYEVKE